MGTGRRSVDSVSIDLGSFDDWKGVARIFNRQVCQLIFVRLNAGDCVRGRRAPRRSLGCVHRVVNLGSHKKRLTLARQARNRYSQKYVRSSTDRNDRQDSSRHSEKASL